MGERNRGTSKWTGMYISIYRYQWHIPINFIVQIWFMAMTHRYMVAKMILWNSMAYIVVVIGPRPRIISILQPKPPYMYIKDWYRRIGQIFSSWKEKRVFVTRMAVCPSEWFKGLTYQSDIINTTDHHDHQTPISSWYMEDVPGLRLVKKTFIWCRKGM